MIMVESDKCNICGNKIEQVTIDLPCFRHIDFDSVCENVTLGQCAGCGLIYNTSSYLIDNDDYFSSVEYAASAQSCQIKKSTQGSMKTREYLQAERIVGLFNKNPQSILDIGCNRGEFLKELKNFFPDILCYGQDVNSEFAKYIDPDFTYYSSLNDVNRKFDVVFSSLTLMYVPDVLKLIQEIAIMLEESGVFILHLPNILSAPNNLLMADVFYHFTPENICNLFMAAGFQVDLCDEETFAGELLVLLKYTGVKNNKFKRTVSLNALLERVHKFIDNVQTCPQYNYILGTTLNASLSYLKKSCDIDGFVDENKEKIGQRFYGHKIIHPDELGTDDVVLVPYGVRSVNIAKRLAGLHSAEFVPV